MREDEINRVRSSWDATEFVQNVTAELFYQKLFELDPDLRGLFKGDRRERYQKFVSIVSAAVRGLENVEVLLPAIRALGVRHAEFASSDLHLTSVEQALLWSLEKSLRSDFTPEIRSAWIAACAKLSQTMRSSGAPAPERRIA